MAFTTPKTTGAIIVCCHCGDLFTSLPKGLCGKCSTPEKRAKLDEENRKIWLESKSLTPFVCKFCEREKLAEISHNKYLEK